MERYIFENVLKPLVRKRDTKEVKRLDERKYKESVFTAISVGFFFILAGALFISIPYLFNRILIFFQNFNIVRIPRTEMFFPAPVSPGEHSVVYLALTKFSFVWGFFQAMILMLRFIFNSPGNKKAETASSIVFWFGTSYLTHTFLNKTTTIAIWFVFWTIIIMLIGVSLVVRAIILVTTK